MDRPAPKRDRHRLLPAHPTRQRLPSTGLEPALKGHEPHPRPSHPEPEQRTRCADTSHQHNLYSCSLHAGRFHRHNMAPKRERSQTRLCDQHYSMYASLQSIPMASKQHAPALSQLGSHAHKVGTLTVNWCEHDTAETKAHVSQQHVRLPLFHACRLAHPSQELSH